MDAAALFAHLRQAVPDAVLETLEAVDMPTLAVDREHLLDVGHVLRDDPLLQFALLVDATAVDRLPAEPRFEMVYHFASLGEHFRTAGAPKAAPPKRLRLKVRLPDADPRVPTLTALWPTAGWPEREVFDLFGITFDGHGDLRRILMPDDWTGHPLRKDYPVQIRKEAGASMPLQLSAEEFARNVRASREAAGRRSSGRPSGG
jgi:NADH-quinone oxidoreductase subunit C